MGVGKSTVCEELLALLQPGVYLDGDWCWHMRPFTVTDETKAMVLDNICAMLSRFLSCPDLRYVIFGWVMHQQAILDTICSRLSLDNVRVVKLSLLASENVLRKRLERDIFEGKRTVDVVARSLSYLPLYQELDAEKLSTDALTAAEVAQMIAAHLDAV